MNQTSYSMMLRKLANDYYQNHIGFEEYRSQRKIILDKIDAEFNGSQPKVEATENQDQSSTFMQTVAFYHNSDIDK